MRNPTEGDKESSKDQGIQIDGTFRLFVQRPSGSVDSPRVAEILTGEEDRSSDRDQPPLSAVVRFGDPNIRSPFPPRVSEDYSPAVDDLVIPHRTVIRRGGAVTFQVAPFQQLAIYEPGTDLASIRIEPETLESVAFGPFSISNYRVNDPLGRIHMSPSPGQAELEWTTPSGTFETPGRYLVISVCVPFLSFARMHGWVEVA